MEGFRYPSRKLKIPLKGFRNASKGVSNSTGGIQICFQGFIIRAKFRTCEYEYVLKAKTYIKQFMTDFYLMRLNQNYWFIRIFYDKSRSWWVVMFNLGCQKVKFWTGIFWNFRLEYKPSQIEIVSLNSSISGWVILLNTY